MNIELTELIAALTGKETSRNTECSAPVNRGQNIVVLDRGFVYVGEVEINGDWITIKNAKNIRKWGTTKGLGELINGPLKDTVLDECGEVITHIKALIHFIPCKGF